jgi:hypothetical protein
MGEWGQFGNGDGMVFVLCQDSLSCMYFLFTGVFDLNAWYQAQMPGCHQQDSEELCSYLSFR